MRLFDSFRGPSRARIRDAGGPSQYEQKVLLANYYEALARAGISPDRSRGWDVERAVCEGYERVVWVFRCVNTKATDASALDIEVVDGGDVVDHPLNTLLNDGQANELETGRQLRKRLGAQLDLSKRGVFIEVGWSRGNTPLTLDLLPPGRVRPVPGTTIDPATGRVKAIDYFELTRQDGQKIELDPENVLWIRDAHPLDPYSGITPLESIGMSIELDYFARIYNLNFLRNDGRPGGVLAVKGVGDGTGDVDEKAMDRIEARFGRGPLEAGKLSVISGELTFQDLSGNPRDMAYSELSGNAKVEVLSGFGMGESVIGSAAGRTYDNADHEERTYWLKVQRSYQSVQTTGWARLVGDDSLMSRFNTDKVPFFQQMRQAELDKAAEEFGKGLRNLESYLELAGRSDEIESSAYSRAYYIQAGLQPIAAKKEDEAELGLATEVAGQGAPTGATGTGTDQGGAVPPASGDVTGAGGDTGTGAPAAPPSGPATPPAAAAQPPALPAPPAGTPVSTSAERAALGRALAGEATARKHLHLVPEQPVPARVVIRRETKAAPTPPAEPAAEEPAPADGTVTTAPDLGAWAALEDQLATQLERLTETWIERTVARMTSVKARKGTRHWQGQYAVDTRVGTKAIDGPKAVDEQRWEDDAEAAVHALLAAAAVRSATDAATDLAPDADLPAAEVVAPAVDDVVRFVRESALRQARALVDLINLRDQDGHSMDDIVAAVRARKDRLAAWAKGIAIQAASAVVDGAREAAAARLHQDGAITDVAQQWFTRGDEKVRETHREARGQTRPIGAPFIVGEALLRYPGDPAGPPREVANCRCYLRHRAKSTGKFVPKPTLAAATA